MGQYPGSSRAVATRFTFYAQSARFVFGVRDDGFCGLLPAFRISFSASHNLDRASVFSVV
jgi:hypothetical protein